jgi:hypothetical protein
MKAIISSILIMLCGWTRAQSSAIPSTAQPDYYIDSVRIDFSLFWVNPQDIAKTKISEKDKTNPNGAVYLTWKLPHPVFLSLGNISDKQTLVTTAPILYIIDDSLIGDTANLRIEAAKKRSTSKPCSGGNRSFI